MPLHEMTHAERATIRDALAKATPGPWKWSMEDGSVMSLTGPKYDYDHVLWSEICPACQKRGGRCTAPSDEDARLIAHAPEWLAALLDEVERLEQELTEIAEENRQRGWDRDLLE
jgi:hypothetical protein